MKFFNGGDMDFKIRHSLNSKINFKICLVSLFFYISFFSQAIEKAGKTIVATGDVQATENKVSRALKRKSAVFKSDTVNTGADSKAQLRMIDGALLTLQQQTQLSVINYQYDQSSKAGNLSLDLLKGGLRTITGALEAKSGNYQMKTPVASIGVRGTVYEAEINTGDLFLAAWQGIIDIQVTVGIDPLEFSLGDGEDYRFAIVRANGEVEFLLKIPDLFSQGHSELLLTQNNFTASAFTDEENLVQLDPLNDILPDSSTEDEATLSNDDVDLTGDSFIDNDDHWVATDITPSEIVAQRSGLVTFDHLLDQSITSNLGTISDLTMSMTVNFDTGRVPTGQLSFNDQSGPWFAAFNGIIDFSALELNINFASHGNALAHGNIDGFFLRDANQILGDVELFEINDQINKAGGGFLLTEQP